MASIKMGIIALNMKTILCAFLLAIMSVHTHAEASYKAWRKDEDHCEVCLKVMNDIKLQLSRLPNLKDINRVEGFINHHCSLKNRNLRADEKKFCRHLVPIARQISMPLAHKAKAIEMCKQMHRVDHTICDYKYNTVMPDEYRANKHKYRKHKRNVKRPKPVEPPRDEL